MFVWLLPAAGLLGVFGQLQQRGLWPWWLYVGVAVLGCASCVPSRRRWPHVAAVVAALACGWAWAGLQGGVRLADRLPHALEGVDLVVTGLVASLPQRTPGGLRMRFEPEGATHEGRPVRLPRAVLLSWYSARWPGSGADDSASDASRPASDAPELPRAGQRWRLSVRLKQPHGLQNPQGFDYELWLFEQGLGATGYVRTGKGAARAALLDERAGSLLQQGRQRVRDAIERQVPDARLAGVLAALVVGDQASIAQEDWEVFRVTGVAHLMAISGLHVTLFAWLAVQALGRAWRCWPAGLLRVPAPVAARWGGLAAATAYALFAGWGLPAQRTICMLAAAQLIAASGRRWPWPLVLLWSAVPVTLFDPWALLQPGFWLSFAAVGLLLATGDAGRPLAPPPAGARLALALRAVRRWAAGGVRTQLVATVGLAPLTLLFFRQLSVVGLVANLLAIPCVTLLVTPLALLGVLWPPLWTAAGWVLGELCEVLAVMAQWPGAVWSTAAVPGWVSAAGLAGACVLVLPLPWQLRLLGLPMLAPLLWPAVVRPATGAFEVIALDVGQGGAVVVRTARHTLLYDTGPSYSSESDAGERVLLPVLQALGDRQPDRLVLSHQDTDHVGGALAVLDAHPDVQVSSSIDAAHPLRQRVARHTPCHAGQSWRWDGVRFDVLHPASDQAAPPLRPNQVSCVLKVSNGRHSALLAGDIERGEEARLVSQAGTALAADLLLAPHHGSKTSSTSDFLDAVRPSVAVFQAGYRNRFGHPAPSVLARYQVRGIALVTSPACGAYRWTAGRGECERDLRRRYWHHRMPDPSDGGD
ncbi:DNA internalization-related competence protein ComEC/Rec2 [Caldimonas brevitalea]|uniref:Competence protein ComEC n=1 Tax=Caldimonas brevitalea TaxID=413882 RepID=A0A0G3BPA8_9BURK|nr:DNA internalization-related competence protein ComEC/Rec2 [Caldimonas brevitalea]AKJ28395.1 competence protein ComEC [Caldimonas brevitalea]